MTADNPPSVKWQSLVVALWRCISEMQDNGHVAGDPVPTGYLSVDDADLLAETIRAATP